MSRFPALVVATSWCVALAATVVLAPSQPTLGVVAIALALPSLALALVLRPAVLSVALAFALLGVGRAELPPSDPQTPIRAAALVGQIATITGRVADDSRPSSGGGQVLVEPARIVIGTTQVSGIGNLMVRWRGPTQTVFGLLGSMVTAPIDCVYLSKTGLRVVPPFSDFQTPPEAVPTYNVSLPFSTTASIAAASAAFGFTS